jgi:nicotinamidase-related amidase
MPARATALTRHDGGLTADRAVLLLLDYQVGPLWEPESAALRREVVRLASGAKILGVPTILSAQACDEWGPIVPELMAATSGARILERLAPNAWENSMLRRAVESTKPDTLIIAGVAIELGVASTALAAARAGHKVRVVVDVSGSVTPSTTECALRRLLRAGVRVTGIVPLLLDLLFATAAETSDGDVLALALRHTLPDAGLCFPPDAPAMDSGLALPTAS